MVLIPFLRLILKFHDYLSRLQLIEHADIESGLGKGGMLGYKEVC